MAGAFQSDAFQNDAFQTEGEGFTGGHGQAQAWIEQTYYQHGQAQAQIKQTYYVHGQAQALIGVLNYGLGQAQATIKATSNVHGQAQADILQTYNVHGQAQARIKQTTNRHAQARAYINAPEPYVEIAFVGAGTGVSATSGTVAVPWPSHQTDDVAILVVETTGGQAGALATANGFQAIPDVSPIQIGSGTSGTRLTLYWHRATSGAMSDPVIQGPGNHIYGRIVTYRNVRKTGNPWNVLDAYNGKVAASTSLTATPIFGNVNTQRYIKALIIATWDDDTSAAHFSNWANSRFELTNEDIDEGTTDGNGGGVAIWGGIKQALGTFGTTTATVTNSINAVSMVGLVPPRVILGQAQAFIQTENRFASGQAQAAIKNTYYQHGQAQAEITRDETYAHGQAQAYIILIVPKHGQSQAWIKSITSKSGQAQAHIEAPFRYAQAQAYIKEINESSGQAQAFIISHRRWFGQAQAYIKSIPMAFGQSRAKIKRSEEYGQAQGTIKQNYYKHGQAQGKIIYKQSAFGQSQALIEVQAGDEYVFKDTFTRVEATNVLGTPDIGTYGLLSHDGDFDIDGSKLVIDFPTFGFIFTRSTGVTASTVTVTMDFNFVDVVELDQSATVYARRASGNFVGLDLFIDDDGGPVTRLSLFDSLAAGTEAYFDVITANTWYTLKMELSGTSMKGKYWERDNESEPDWMITRTTSWVTGGNLEFDFFAADTPTEGYLDNLNAYIPGAGGITAGYGQTQAYIYSPLRRSHGQAQARIVHPAGYGQAQALIAGDIVPQVGQAQALIVSPGHIAHGAARAFIVKPQQVAQAQARILAFGQSKHGQARARILASTTRYAHGQAQALVKGPAFGQAAAMIESKRYLVRYNNYDLPGYIQEEQISSIQNIMQHTATYVDGSLSEYTGLQNKLLSIRMKAFTTDYAEAKKEAQNAATMLRSGRGFVKFYLQKTDRYYLALTKSVSAGKIVGDSMRTLDYAVELETKPWLISDAIYTVSGVTTVTTAGRTLSDGGWTPARIEVDGTDITISGYCVQGMTGWAQIEGTVSNFIIDTDSYTSSDDTIINPDYALYVGPGETTFEVEGATRVVITYNNRWYL